MCKMHKSNLTNEIKSKKMTMEQVKKGKSNVKRDSIIKASQEIEMYEGGKEHEEKNDQFNACWSNGSNDVCRMRKQ